GPRPTRRRARRSRPSPRAPWARGPPTPPGSSGRTRTPWSRRTPGRAGTSGSRCWTGGGPRSDPTPRSPGGSARRTAVAACGGGGPAEPPHDEIARWVGEEHGVGGWWAQGVTVAYEQARGLRAPRQRRGGLFEVIASKTVAVPVERLYEAFIDPDLRERWLPGASMEVRTAR